MRASCFWCGAVAAVVACSSATPLPAGPAPEYERPDAARWAPTPAAEPPEDDVDPAGAEDADAGGNAAPLTSAPVAPSASAPAAPSGSAPRPAPSAAPPPPRP